MISEAVRPVVLAGNGVIRGHASEALVRFAERLNIPVATTFMAKGVIPDTHPLALGAIGLQTPDYVNFAFAEADLVIAVGYDVVEYAPRSWNPKCDKRIVHVDMAPAEVDAAYIVNVGVVGDIASSLDALAQRATPHSTRHGSQFRQNAAATNWSRAVTTLPSRSSRKESSPISAPRWPTTTLSFRTWARTNCGWRASSRAISPTPASSRTVLPRWASLFPVP